MMARPMPRRRIPRHWELMPMARSRSHPMVRKINMAYDISVGIIDCILKRLARVGIQVGIDRVRRGTPSPWFAASVAVWSGR
jgi:hypothetical protein